MQVLFTFIVISIIVLLIVSKKNNKQSQTQAPSQNIPSAQKAEAIIAESRRKAEERIEERKREQQEWETKHGRITVALAGVTFDNDDGTSRQRLLKDLKARGGDADLNLQEFEYKGQPAVRVLVDGECIGNIPKTKVQEVLDVFDRIENASLNVECFHPDDDDFEDEAGSKRRKRETIYRADLTIIYSKVQQEQ